MSTELEQAPQPSKRVSSRKGKTVLPPELPNGMAEVGKSFRAARKEQLLQRQILQKKAMRHLAVTKGRGIWFATPCGVERLSRLLIGSLSPSLNQQELSRKAGIAIGIINSLDANFHNTKEGIITHAISMETVFNLSPHLPNGDKTGVNPWFLTFMACGFLDERKSSEDLKELEEAVGMIKQAID